MLNASIVINSVNGEQLHRLCSTLAASDNLHTLFIFDNSRYCLPQELTDNLSAILADRNKSFSYTWNKGRTVNYGKCHNIAVRQTVNQHLRYHLIIDGNTEITENTVDCLHLFMEKNLTVGGVIPKVVKENGDTEYLCRLLPSPFDFLFRKSEPSQRTAVSSRYYLQNPANEKMMNIPYLNGCCMLLRTKAVQQAGFYDEKYHTDTSNMAAGYNRHTQTNRLITHQSYGKTGLHCGYVPLLQQMGMDTRSRTKTNQ